jgi:hypothetical protein
MISVTLVEDAELEAAVVEDAVAGAVLAEAVLDAAPAQKVSRTTNLRRRSPSYVGSVAKRAID